LILAALCAAALASTPQPYASIRSFQADVDFVVRSIETTHPAPYSFVQRSALSADAKKVKESTKRVGTNCAMAQLMALVAELHDGHTYVAPINVAGEMKWFPIRFYWLSDGLYITSAAPEYSDLVGKKVVKIGSLSASSAMDKVIALQAANNPLAAHEGTVWLSQAAIADAIGAADQDSMSVTVSESDGSETIRVLRPFEADINDAWYQQGEMFGPRTHKDVQPYVTAFGGRGPLDFRKFDSALPPHLRYRLPYYLLEIPESKAVYFQWNFVEDWGDEPFEKFVKRLFADVDAHPDWKLIVDVRYNSGGDGSKVPQLIKQIIKRSRFDEPGSLFVIIGRKTFSAAADFVGEAKQWTSAIFVGEPTGAGLNAYGDPRDITTPNLKIPFQVSTVLHQHGAPTDQAGEFAPDIPAIMSGKDYFSGRDPALETVLAGVDLLPLPALGVQAGGDAARIAFAARAGKWSSIPWWKPFGELDMNAAGYVALRSGKSKDAVILFQMNADQYPRSWNTWDSLAEAQRAAGLTDASILSYRKALSLYPGDDGATEAIEEMMKTEK
jgi:hypothetical protein